MLDGWKEWWGRAETDVDSSRKEKRLNALARRMLAYQERVKSNILLIGWRTWS